MKQILIIDDNTDLRKLICLTLSTHYKVREAANADEGILLAESMQPDLIVLDIMMPGSIDGLEFLRRYRQSPAGGRGKVVLVTARNQPEDRHTAAALSVDAYFVKPFSPLQLSDKIRELIP